MVYEVLYAQFTEWLIVSSTLIRLQKWFVVWIWKTNKQTLALNSIDYVAKTSYLPTWKNILTDRAYRRPCVRNSDVISILTNASAAGTMWIRFERQTNPDSIPALSSIRYWFPATTWDVFAKSSANLTEAIGKRIFSQIELRIRRQLRSS